MQLCSKPRGARGIEPETLRRRGQLLSRPPTTGLRAYMLMTDWPCICMGMPAKGGGSLTKEQDDTSHEGDMSTRKCSEQRRLGWNGLAHARKRSSLEESNRHRVAKT